MNNQYATILASLPDLRAEMYNIKLEYGTDHKIIGQAMAYLNLLEDLILQFNQKEKS